MNYVVSEFKVIGDNPYEQYYEKVVRVLVRGDIKSITGKVIALSDRFLTLEHLDKRTTLIRTEEITVITEKAPRRED